MTKQQKEKQRALHKNKKKWTKRMKPFDKNA